MIFFPRHLFVHFSPPKLQKCHGSIPSVDELLFSQEGVHPDQIQVFTPYVLPMTLARSKLGSLANSTAP